MSAPVGVCLRSVRPHLRQLTLHSARWEPASRWREIGPLPTLNSGCQVGLLPNAATQSLHQTHRHWDSGYVTEQQLPLTQGSRNKNPCTYFYDTGEDALGKKSFYTRAFHLSRRGHRGPTYPAIPIRHTPSIAFPTTMAGHVILALEALSRSDTKESD